ncbi:MAG: zinc ribbon domain-containing protein [Chthoniobacterales bacterium]
MALLCASCGYENDPTRVYCHNCGVRLERGNVAPPPTGFTHPTDVAKMRKPRQPVAWGRYFSALFKVAFLAVLVAAVVLALLPPLDVPDPVEPDENLASRLGSLLNDAATSPEARAFGLPAGDINRWLVSSVALQGAGGTIQLQPERLYAVPENGQVRVGLEVNLAGVTAIFFEGDYAPVRGGNGYTLEPRRYSVGRLPLPVLLGWPVQKQLDGLGEALTGPLGQLSRASYIGVSPEMVTLRWSGSGQ